MESNLSELRYKEVISVTDGTRFGYVSDLCFDLDTGQIRGLLVQGPGRFFFGLFGPRETWLLRWEQVKRFGPDIILTEGEPEVRQKAPKRKKWFDG